MNRPRIFPDVSMVGNSEVATTRCHLSLYGDSCPWRMVWLQGLQFANEFLSDMNGDGNANFWPVHQRVDADDAPAAVYHRPAGMTRAQM